MQRYLNKVTNCLRKDINQNTLKNVDLRTLHTSLHSIGLLTTKELKEERKSRRSWANMSLWNFL